MKVAIVTLNANDSFGNRLQNYALQKTLENIGCEVETLYNTVSDALASYTTLANFSKHYLKERRINFFDFQQVEQLGKEYDFFIVGSDQVWNGNFSYVEKFLDVFLLKFASPEKRLSYAASFGGKSLPSHLLINYIIGLNEMAALSVREESGAQLIQELCGRKTYVHVDPTLLISEEQYRKLARAHKDKPTDKYAVYNFLFDITDQQTVEIEQFAIENNLKLVDLNGLLINDEIGIEEFIDYMMDAEYVLTDSFHCTVFSVIFHKRFISYVCNIENVGSRVEDLLKKFDLSDRQYIQGKPLIEQFLRKSTDVSEKVEEEKKKSLDYLRRTLYLPRVGKADIVPDKNMCYGCGACKNVCPANCISMTADREGFNYPRIDQTKCIHCEKCKQVCPALNPAEVNSLDYALAIKHKCDDVRKNSTSGGAFTALYSKIIQEGGIVFGAAYDENQKVVHCSAETMAHAEAFRGSKYAQSDLGDCLAEAKYWLERGRKVLFSGTPCQIGALKNFLKKPYENLIAVDLICHGVPSPLAWKKYIEYHEKIEGSHVTKANMRMKVNSWSSPTLELVFANGKALRNNVFEDPYYLDFVTDVSLRECCYNCGLKGLQRTSDLTLADFWGANSIIPDMYDEKGVSLVLVNTEKGEALLNSVKSQLNLKKVDLKEAIEYNPAAKFSSEKNGKRSTYFAKLEETKWYV